MRSVLLLSLALSACKPPLPGTDPAELLQADANGVSIAAGAPQWKYVETATAVARAPLSPLPVPGHIDLDPRRAAAVGVPLPGRVDAVLVRLGAHVQQGDKLFSVRSGAFAELGREIASARALVTTRQRLVARAQNLYALKAAAQKDLLAAEAELKEAELALQAAESRQRSLAVDTESDNLYWVHATRGGTVVEFDLSTGQEVGPDREQPLLRVCDLDEVLVIADVPEGDVRDVRVGQPATILPSFAAERREGVVEHVSDVVDPRRRTVAVWVRAMNADRLLRPNAFAEVAFEPDPAQQIVCVPDSAVVTQGTRSVVFLVANAGRLEPRPVQLGRRRDGITEIRAGLAPGEGFVARGALLLLNQVDLATGN